MILRNTLLFILLASQAIFAQIVPQWIRYPAISPDGQTIAFTYKGDIYKISTLGGIATQLTFHTAHDYMPIWSPDGRKIAFASNRHGNFDVFIMDARGGEAQRLTFHSNDEQPFSFSPDGKNILSGALRQDLADHRQYPTASQPELYSVPAVGGKVDQILTVPAENAQYSRDGSFIVYHDKKGGENEWRKHQKSSIARDIWKYDIKTGKHTAITNYYYENRQPVLANDDKDIYYLSEENGNFNIFKLSLDSPNERKQISHMENYPVRFLSISNDGLLSFSYDGELYTMREGETPQKVNIQIFTQSVSNNDGFVKITGGINEYSLSPDGKEVAFTNRGDVFVTSVDGKTTKRITTTPENERFVSFAPDGKSIYYAGERDGRWQIFKSEKVRNEEPFFYASTLIKETPVISNEKDNYQPKISPDGKKLAFIEDRRTLKVIDLTSKKEVTLMTPEHLYHMRDGDQYFDWSPDSKWILANYKPTMSNGEVVIMDAEGKKGMINITQSGFNDYSPKWVDDQIIWFSNRDGMRSAANSGGQQADVYSTFLNRESWDKFNLSKDDYNLFKELNKSKDSSKSKDSTKTKEIVPIQIDWDDITDRKARLTIHSSALSDAVLSKDGETLYYLARFEKNANLWKTDLRTKDTKMVMALDGSGGRLEWDKDKKFIYFLSGGKLSKINPDNNKRETISIDGEADFDLDAERRHQFDHVWLRTQKIFYTPDMHGVDWDKLKVEYEKYVPHISNNYEFAEMISELLGELNVSHAGARYSSSDPNGDATASLGIFMDYGYQGNGIRIEEIIKQGPLDKSSFKVEAGQIIEKIDGETIRGDRDVATYLNRKANKFTLLEIFDPKTNTRQEITVKPINLAQENQLLYKRWVKRNQAEVEKLSNGQLGYIHIPGMNDGQYRNTYEEMMGKYADSKAMIIDTRFNSGGDLVADLAMFLTGEKFLEYATADRPVGYEPFFRWNKPSLAMFNEANYSDGHCFSSGYSELKIGKTVGMPVPGTCSFAGWEVLPGGVRWGAVPVSVRNKAGEWMENNETRPNFVVKNDPQKIAEGQDQQLEKAIEELLKDVN